MQSRPSHRAVVVGSSFAGITAALELRKQLDDADEVLVLDPRADFTFIPSLIWLPFGIRTAGDVTFPLEPMYARKGIRFVNRAAERIDPVARTVTTGDGEEIEYDRLLIATGPRLAFEKIPGLGPDGGHTQSVCNLDHAGLLAREASEAFREPGPVVVGTAQGGSCFGASYEFLFNIKHRIKKAGLEDVAPVTFITAEPYLGHFGLGGVGDSSQRVERFFDRLGIEGLPNSAINEVRDGEIELESGRTLPFAYSMIVPPFTGVDAVRRVDGLGNAAGFIPVDDEFRHPQHKEIYSAGVAIAIAPPSHRRPGRRAQDRPDERDDGQGRGPQHRRRPPRRPAQAPASVRARGDLRTGRRQQRHRLQGRPRARPERRRRPARIMAGPQAHWAKLAFERYFLASRKRGLVGV